MLKKGVYITILSNVSSNIMNLSEYLIKLQESSNVEESDNIEYCIEELDLDNSDFGEIKTDLPEKEGLDLARKAAEQFVDASDGEDIDIDLDIDESLPSNDSGFNESFDQNIDSTTVTIPTASEEDDQFSDPDDEIEVDGTVTDRELASDDDDFAIEESATGWDDLF